MKNKRFTVVRIRSPHLRLKSSVLLLLILLLLLFSFKRRKFIKLPAAPAARLFVFCLVYTNSITALPKRSLICQGETCHVFENFEFSPRIA